MLVAKFLKGDFLSVIGVAACGDPRASDQGRKEQGEFGIHRSGGVVAKQEGPGNPWPIHPERNSLGRDDDLYRVGPVAFDEDVFQGLADQ